MKSRKVLNQVSKRSQWSLFFATPVENVPLNPIGFGKEIQSTLVTYFLAYGKEVERVADTCIFRVSQQVSVTMTAYYK